MKTLRQLVGVFTILLLSTVFAEDALPEPSPEFSPEEVVRIQLEALANNDVPYDDAGIEITYRFASPGNRQVTGPLERFVAMVKGPAYGDMLNHISAQIGQPEVTGNRAQLAVILVTADARRVGYLFVVGRQQGGDCPGCWMTESVVPFRPQQRQQSS